MNTLERSLLSRCLPKVAPEFVDSRTTLAKANERRGWRIYADFAQSLIPIARKRYVDDELGLELDNTIYASSHFSPQKLRCGIAVPVFVLVAIIKNQSGCQAIYNSANFERHAFRKNSVKSGTRSDCYIGGLQYGKHLNLFGKKSRQQ